MISHVSVWGRTAPSVSAYLIAGLIFGGCTVGGGDIPRIGVDAGGTPDAGAPPDGSVPDGSLPPVNPCASRCGDTELCGGEGTGTLSDGNGLDDDCDGEVDEGCSCEAPGVTRPCFAGPPDRRNLGVCADGVETCNEFLIWGGCLGGVSPSAESCDGADNDCNGMTDDLSGCDAGLVCPGNEVSPPLTSHMLRGSRLTIDQPVTAWRWEVDCPASVPDALCPTPDNPTAEETPVYFTASGAYRVNVSVMLQDGSEAQCGWTVYVQGSGLRVELNWDTMGSDAGNTDVDLHLHRWTQNGVDTDYYDEDDCYYANCRPDDDTLTWSDHPDTALENCEDVPHGGGDNWRFRGSCRNPRLDIDTNGSVDCVSSVSDPSQDTFCAPENINVDEPIVGMPYRIMVNYYDDDGVSGPTYPTVNIYCGGAIRGSFGTDPFVPLTTGSDLNFQNDHWLVADVVFFEGTCGLDCRIMPLGDIIRAEPRTPVQFGPAWSCDYNPTTRTCD